MHFSIITSAHCRTKKEWNSRRFLTIFCFFLNSRSRQNSTRFSSSSSCRKFNAILAPASADIDCWERFQERQAAVLSIIWCVCCPIITAGSPVRKGRTVAAWNRNRFAAAARKTINFFCRLHFFFFFGQGTISFTYYTRRTRGYGDRASGLGRGAMIHLFVLRGYLRMPCGVWGVWGQDFIRPICWLNRTFWWLQQHDPRDSRWTPKQNDRWCRVSSQVG